MTSTSGKRHYDSVTSDHWRNRRADRHNRAFYEIANYLTDLNEGFTFPQFVSCGQMILLSRILNTKPAETEDAGASQLFDNERFFSAELLRCS